MFQSWHFSHLFYLFFLQSRTQSDACQNDKRSQKDLYYCDPKDHSRAGVEQPENESGIGGRGPNAFQNAISGNFCCSSRCDTDRISRHSSHDECHGQDPALGTAVACCSRNCISIGRFPRDGGNSVRFSSASTQTGLSWLFCQSLSKQCFEKRL